MADIALAVTRLRIVTYNLCEGGQDRISGIAALLRRQHADVIALVEANSRANVETLGHRRRARGVLGEVLGLRATLGIAAVATIAATVALRRSPVWTTSRVDELEDRLQSGNNHLGKPPTGASATVRHFHGPASAGGRPN